MSELFVGDVDDEEAPLTPCPKSWRTRVGDHECLYSKGHRGKCLCLCGKGHHKVRPL